MNVDAKWERHIRVAYLDNFIEKWVKKTSANQQKEIALETSQHARAERVSESLS